MGNCPLRMKIRRGRPPSGVVATAESDPELTARLEAYTPPSPELLRFLGKGHGSRPRPAPVPFFPEVQEELMKLWMAPFSAGSYSSASPILTTLDGGVVRGSVDIPQVKSAVVLHLCLQNAATWRNRPCLPSKT